eukprot:CAMPEP_0168338548 /NCGR_PEP_ID=MMETSP0213-20121227/12914_1 /TAXON_ID=151035 /ORGANISM="Euplotes harpa, Strain FSP1.4" /LENGTH=66 /DNA_ID=CAMNT_0008344375 /DNA_START=465 /DNA_END=665 /DNA_ORIENTATION=-
MTFTYKGELSDDDSMEFEVDDYSPIVLVVRGPEDRIGGFTVNYSLTDSKKLSAGAIVGIVLGSVAF